MIIIQGKTYKEIYDYLQIPFIETGIIIRTNHGNDN